MKMYPNTPLNILSKVLQRRVRNRVLGKNLLRGENEKQNPTFYDALSAPWCFNRCAPGQLIEINYYTGKKPINETDTTSFLKSLPTAEKNKNAVFIGRETSVIGCDDGDAKRIDAYPFGCNILSEFSGGYVTGRLGKAMESKTTVNIRERMPFPTLAGRELGCTVRTVPKGGSIIVTGSLEMVYAGDIFYWATIEGAERCPKTQLQTN